MNDGLQALAAFGMGLLVFVVALGIELARRFAEGWRRRRRIARARKATEWWRAAR